MVRLQSLTQRFTLVAKLNSQWADQKILDGSESFSLGGPQGVRAYPSSEGSKTLKDIHSKFRLVELLKSGCPLNPKLGIKQSMGDVGACWDNAVVERFFGSLKHDWILKAQHPTYESMAADVAAYMKYYNLKRLHTSNGDMTPVEYENYQLKVSTWA